MHKQKSDIKTKVQTNHGDRREYVVTSILERVVNGQLRAGERLVTQDLADQLNVSLTPVREALAELSGIGIIDLLPNRGATIHAFSRQEIRDVCRVRRALECEAVRGAIGRIPPSKLRELDSQFAALSQAPVKGTRMIRRARELDSQLHDLVKEHCDNVFLQKELTRLARLFRSLRDASWIDSQSRDDCDRLAEEAREHSEITQAMLKRDSKAAVNAMSRHITASARYWSRGNTNS
jgi:DNA-binding GntR family transcriptional regulator